MEENKSRGTGSSKALLCAGRLAARRHMNTHTEKMKWIAFRRAAIVNIAIDFAGEVLFTAISSV